jgi:hypothetical protein
MAMVGNHIQTLLLAKRVEITGAHTLLLKEVRDRSEGQHQQGLATHEEIDDEMKFFRKTLEYYDGIFSILRKERNIYSSAQIQMLKTAINNLKSHWPTKRWWEDKPATCTPKGHDIWFHILLKVEYLGRFLFWMEDPIEVLHKDDKLLDRVYCHMNRDYKRKEEAKREMEEMISAASV